MLRRKHGTVLALAAAMGWFLLSGVALAQGGIGDDQHNHNAPYLRMGVGARALGMGGAFVAVANDVTAGYWNPAGLTWTNGWQIGGMYSSGMEVDRKYNHIGFSRNSHWGAYGFNWLSAGMSDINWRGIDGSDLGEGDFKDDAFMLSLAKQFDILSLGISGKYLRQSLDASVPGDDAISGYGIDIGMGLMLAEQFRFGFNVQDIAGKLGSDDDANDIPTNLRAGVAVWPIEGMTVAFDVQKTQQDDDYRFHIGGEYAIPLTEDLGAAMRAGINDGKFAAGFGMSFNFLHAEYAYVNDAQAFLNENHRFSVALKFAQKETDWDARETEIPDYSYDDYVEEEEPPPPPEPASEFQMIPVYANINFKFGTAEISGADPIPVLEEVARMMRENPDAQLKVIGHTDSVGSEESNLWLSHRRADAVKDYIVNRGVDSARVMTEGKGEGDPIDTNDTDLGRARNRRIEFQVIR